MKIFTLWETDKDPDTIPWIVDATDEYTIDAHCDFPPDYKAKRADPRYRELIIDVPEKAVRALFGVPEVKATVVEP